MSLPFSVGVATGIIVLFTGARDGGIMLITVAASLSTISGKTNELKKAPPYPSLQAAVKRPNSHKATATLVPSGQMEQEAQPVATQLTCTPS